MRSSDCIVEIKKTISFNFYFSDFQENIFKASCAIAKSNKNFGNVEIFCGGPY